MLTKSECVEAYEILYGNYKITEENKDDFEYACEILERLIDKHFDNPPLKFEELKEGMWIWDNKDKAYMKIESVCDKDWVWLYIDSSEREHIDELYEPNRFYRKEVQE